MMPKRWWMVLRKQRKNAAGISRLSKRQTAQCLMHLHKLLKHIATKDDATLGTSRFLLCTLLILAMRAHCLQPTKETTSDRGMHTIAM